MLRGCPDLEDDLLAAVVERLPEALGDILTRHAEEDVLPVEMQMERVRERLSALEDSVASGGWVDEDAAEEIGEVLMELLDDASEREAPQELYLLHAVVSFFAEGEEIESDAHASGGLEDERRVVQAAADILGRLDLAEVSADLPVAEIV